MAQSTHILSQWASLRFLEGLDSYFKEDDDNKEDFCIYDLMKKIKGQLTYEQVIAAVRQHDNLENEWADYICLRLQCLGLAKEEIKKMFKDLSGTAQPGIAKKPRKDKPSLLEPRPLKQWTDRRIASLVESIKDLDDSLCPEKVRLVLTNEEDKKDQEAGALVAAFENVKLGQIIQLVGDANIVSKVKDRIPNGVAVTQNVKQILDFLVSHVKQCSSGALYVVGPSGCSKTVATALCATYCLNKKVFHICLWDTVNLAKGATEEAKYVLRAMYDRNPLELWQAYGCDQEMYNLAGEFVPGQNYLTEQDLLTAIVSRLDRAQRDGKIVVSIVDNCQSILNETEMSKLLKAGSNDAKIEIRKDSRMRWLLPSSGLGLGDKLVIIALASQHAKFDGILETEELLNILRLSVPMDLLDLLSLKRVLSSFVTYIPRSEVWAAVSKALTVSGCIPRHAYNHMSSVIGGAVETQDFQMLFDCEPTIVTSIVSNVKKYLDDAEASSEDKNAFSQNADAFMRKILAGSTGELSKDVVDANPVIDYGILTPLPTVKDKFRYINKLHQNIHLQQLAAKCEGLDVYIPNHADDFEAILISRILAKGISLRRGRFNSGAPCTLENLAAPESVISISRIGGSYTSSKSDRGLVNSALAGTTTFSLMVTCPANYESVDVFVLCRQRSAVLNLYCIQITRAAHNVVAKFKNIQTAVNNFFDAVLGEKINLDLNKMDVGTSRATTRNNVMGQIIRVFVVLVSLNDFDSLNTGIPKNRFVLFCGKKLLEDEFLVTIQE